MEQNTGQNEFEHRFERLVTAVVDKRTVPFVGAGFSGAAESLVEGFYPSVNWLNKRLTILICKKLSWKKETSIALKPASRKNYQRLFYRACREGSLGKLAEIAQLLCKDAKEVLEQINIGLFATLSPSPAHRYMAYLVREGLIDEVITTNYDTCLEDAYRQSFGDVCDSKCPHAGNGSQCEFHFNGGDRNSCFKNPGDCSSCPVQSSAQCRYIRYPHCRYFGVVHNLMEYRRYGARSITKNPPRVPILRVYKINGCVREYIHHTFCNSDKGYFPRILLSERELQEFGKEVWAGDLLKDRARSRALMFVGFGSDEPQVRHNVLTLMEEFQGIGKKKGLMEAEDIPKLPNAPFMIAYEPCLSFNQMQVMSGFVNAHYDHGNGGDAADRIETALENTITGRDNRYFQICGEDVRMEEHLKADDFMKWLFQAVFGRLLRRYSDRGTNFYQWLDRNTAYPAVWRSQMIASLYPAKANGEPGLFPRYPDLFEFTSRAGHYNLWQWLLCLMKESSAADTSNGKGPESPQDFYLALRDASFLILVFLTILTSLLKKDGNSSRLPRVTAFAPVGLEIRTDDSDTPLYLSFENRPVKARWSTSETSHWGRLYRIIDLPSQTYLPSRGRLCRESDESSETKIKDLYVGNFIRVSVSDWFRCAQKPDRLCQSITEVFSRHFASRAYRRPIKEKI